MNLRRTTNLVHYSRMWMFVSAVVVLHLQVAASDVLLASSELPLGYLNPHAIMTGFVVSPDSKHFAYPAAFFGKLWVTVDDK